MKNRLKFYLKKIKEGYNELSGLKRITGIKPSEYLRLKYEANKSHVSLFGKEIQVTDAFWHLHSVDELFVNAQYDFSSKKKNPTIIDCGANVGLSAIFFKKIFPAAHVIAYEADPEIYKMLLSNLSVFGFNDVDAQNKAVWVENGTMKFSASGALGGALNFSETFESNLVEVPTIRLRDVIENQKIDFLKIDIEGAEISVLEDCKDVLGNVENLFVEYHRRNGDQNQISPFLAIMENAGFKLYIKEAWNNLPKPFKYKDYNPHFDLQLNIFCYR